MSKFSLDQEVFIDKYVKALKENNAVVFAGAGMSVASGFFDWQKLLKPIADRLRLDIKEETDLTALAQYFVDKQGGRGELNQILVDEYGKMGASPTENHQILARLPIQIYWTTNYDTLIEDALKANGKTPDVKKSQGDLSVNFPRRDAIIYKMHGDIATVAETVLTKHEYEDYNTTRELFSNAFKSDFVARTFLFIGFSFTDPNLDYLISRIRSTLGRNKKPDYFFIKRDSDEKRQHRLTIRIESLRQYGLNAIWIDEYSEITDILREIEARYLRSSVLVSGSAEEYGSFTPENAGVFLHNLSYIISKNRYKLVSGFGWGVGSAVINGVLDNMTQARNLNLDNFLVLRPFPQFQTGTKPLRQLWTEYREAFIPLAGIAIFVFGNKRDAVTREIVSADGLMEEFEIAVKAGLKIIPIGATGYVAEELWNKVMDQFEVYYPEHPDLKDIMQSLGNKSLEPTTLINNTLNMINQLNNNYNG